MQMQRGRDNATSVGDEAVHPCGFETRGIFGSIRDWRSLESVRVKSQIDLAHLVTGETEKRYAVTAELFNVFPIGEVFNSCLIALRGILRKGLVLVFVTLVSKLLPV